MSNFNTEVCQRVVKKMPRRFTSTFIQFPEAINELGECFSDGADGALNIPEETVHNLLEIAEVFDMKNDTDNTRLSQLESKKVLRCLKAIELLEVGIRKSKEDELCRTNSFGGIGTEKRFRSSLRAINVNKVIMASIDVGVLDILNLLREYFEVKRIVG